MFASFSKRLLSKLRSKKYRDAYVAENVRTGIAYQIRAMREQRDAMSQKDLGKLMHKPQSVVSRLEDPDYGKLTLQTLLRVAAAFDVALLVQFVTHEEFLRRTLDVSPRALEVDSFSSIQLQKLEEADVRQEFLKKFNDGSLSIGPATEIRIALPTSSVNWQLTSLLTQSHTTGVSCSA